MSFPVGTYVARMHHARVQVPSIGASRQLVYTDASIRRSRGGVGALWLAPDRQSSLAARVAEHHDINRLEMMAILLGLLFSEPSHDLLVLTDSQASLGQVRRATRDKYGGLAACIHHLRRARAAPTSFQWVKAHKGEPGNEAADALAKRGGEQHRGVVLPLPDTLGRDPRTMLMTFLEVAEVDRSLTLLADE